MDKLVSMEAFVRVAEVGSFAEAARRWGRSKASVSAYVAQLEDHLGVRLLHRTTRRVSLTDTGAGHLERCRELLAQLADAEDEARAEASALRGTLRVTAPGGLVARHQSALVGDFLARWPDITLDLMLTNRMVDLVAERIDVALRLTEPADSTLVARRLAPAPLVVVASPGFLAGHGRLDAPADLAGVPCLRDTNFGFDPQWPFREGSVRVSGPLAADSPLVVRAMALAGHGVALSPRLLVADDLAAGALVELFPGEVDVGWSIWAVTSQRRRLPARARVFIEHARAVLAEG